MKSTKVRPWLSGGLLASLAFGCAQPTTPAVRPTLSLAVDNQAAVARLANPLVVDWSSRLVVSAAAQRAHQPETGGSERGLLSLGVSSQAAGTGFAGGALR